MSRCWCGTPRCWRAFTDAFEAAGIPYVVNRGKGFYDTREVNDLTHLLRVIANPRDEIALAAVLRSPLVGASDEDLLALRMRGRNHRRGSLMPRRRRLPRSIWRVSATGCANGACGASTSPSTGCCSPPSTTAATARNRARAGTPISTSSWRRRATPPRACRSTNSSTELALVRESNPREPDAPPEDSANAVKLMTVHSAKGLEFPVVFVAALHKGIDIESAGGGVSRRGSGSARAGACRGRGRKRTTSSSTRFAAERKQREAEESHRLLYVAMTRAEQHLVLSFSGQRPGNWAKVVVEASAAIDLDGARDEVSCSGRLMARTGGCA